MDKTVTLREEDLIADLQSPEAEIRRKAAQALGYLTPGDDQEVNALIDVMQNDCEFKVREMAYWALSSPANLKILCQHPDWQARDTPIRAQKTEATQMVDGIVNQTENTLKSKGATQCTLKK